MQEADTTKRPALGPGQPFKLSNLKVEDVQKLTNIGRRVMEMFDAIGLKVNGLHVVMDLSAVHQNGCPLDLQAMLDATGTDLARDVLGIMLNLDRSTGRLLNGYEPEFRLREVESKYAALANSSLKNKLAQARRNLREETKGLAPHEVDRLDENVQRWVNQIVELRQELRRRGERIPKERVSVPGGGYRDVESDL